MIAWGFGESKSQADDNLREKAILSMTLMKHSNKQ